MGAVMKTSECKSVAMIAVLIAAVLTSGCVRHGSAGARSGTAASEQEAPAAIRYQDHIWAGGVPPPGGVLSTPQGNSAQSAKGGEALFNSMNCDGCHGSGGSGSVGPNLADGRWRYGGRDGEIFMSIFYGRPKGMPAFGGILGQGGVWLLVSYLKSLPKPETVPTESWSDTPSTARPAQ
jgi:cytochrome c oxidase cbb3-type subunit III